MKKCCHQVTLERKSEQMSGGGAKNGNKSSGRGLTFAVVSWFRRSGSGGGDSHMGTVLHRKPTSVSLSSMLFVQWRFWALHLSGGCQFFPYNSCSRKQLFIPSGGLLLTNFNVIRNWRNWEWDWPLISSRNLFELNLAVRTFLKTLQMDTVKEGKSLRLTAHVMLEIRRSLRLWARSIGQCTQWGWVPLLFSQRREITWTLKPRGELTDFFFVANRRGSTRKVS